MVRGDRKDHQEEEVDMVKLEQREQQVHRDHPVCL